MLFQRICLMACAGILLFATACAKEAFCIVGKEGGCPKDSYCYAKTGVESEGVCIYGEQGPNGEVFASITSWRVLQAGVEIQPLRDDVGTVDNPEATWLSSGSFEIEAQVVGQGAGEGFKAWAEDDSQAICNRQTGINIENYVWRCTFAGIQGEGALKLFVQAGANSQGQQPQPKQRTYLLDATLPQLQLQVHTTGLLGDEIRVCLASNRASNIDTEILTDSLGIKTWQRHDNCWMATLPLSANLDTQGTSLWQAQVQARAKSTSGKTQETLLTTNIIQLRRLACNSQISSSTADAMHLPLAWTGSHVVAASSLLGGSAGNNTLFFIDPKTCGADSWVHVGHMGGPVVVLGNTGDVAVATISDGPMGRESARTAVVNASGFIHANVDMDCTAEAIEPDARLIDSRGLVLLQHGDSLRNGWLLSALFVEKSDTDNTQMLRLAAFRPFATNPAQRCAEIFGFQQAAFRPPPAVQTSDGNVNVTVVANLPPQAVCPVRFNGSSWELRNWCTPIEFAGDSIGPVTGMAAAKNNLWLSTGNIGLMRLELVPINLLTASPGSSQVAADAHGRAYVVIGRSLYRCSQEAVSHAHCTASKMDFSGAAVGSPILGEALPGQTAEVYVVSTTGVVHAYEAENLQLLWTQQLNTNVHSEAQPILVGKTLWVVSRQGQMFALRVASNGLCREAQWPKAHHDNCNTSSARTTPQNMPSCFD